MSFLDKIKEGVSRVIPDQRRGPRPSGIGNRQGAMGFEDDMIVSKPAIVFHASQIFFGFLAMCCFASVAAFQAKWKVGPSGLSGFALFVAIFTIVLASGLLAIPVLYERYDKLTRFARVLKEARVSFILGGTGLTLTLLIAFITSISAWTEPGCKNADNDPHAKSGGLDFRNGLANWCATKRAGAVFFWLAFVFWGAHFALLVWDWRRGRLNAPRDPPFTHPVEQDAVDAESMFETIPPMRHGDDGDDDERTEAAYSDPSKRFSAASGNVSVVPPSDYSGYSGARTTQYFSAPSAPSTTGSAGDYGSPARPRQSIDAYGAFSDPPPTGFDAPAEGPPRVSRTMQYADPYAAARAAVGNAQPPSYSNYQGYR